MEERFKLFEQIFNINGNVNRGWFYLSFLDKNLEANYQHYNLEQKSKNFIFVCVILVLMYIIQFFITATHSNYSSPETIITISCMIIDFFITMLYYLIKSIEKKKLLAYTKFFLFLFDLILIVILYVNHDDPIFQILRTLYFFILMKNFIYICFLDNSIIISVILCLLNSSAILYIELNQTTQHALYFEIALEIILGISCYFYKDCYDKLNRNTYLNKYKFKEYLNYSNDLMSGIGGYHFTYIDNKLSYVNSNLRKILYKKYSKIQNISMKETENLKIEMQHIKIGGNIEMRNLDYNKNNEKNNNLEYNLVPLESYNRNNTDENKINNLININQKIECEKDKKIINNDLKIKDYIGNLEEAKYQEIDKKINFFRNEKIQSVNSLISNSIKNKEVNENSFSKISAKPSINSFEGTNKMQYFIEKLNNDFLSQIEEGKISNRNSNNKESLTIRELNQDSNNCVIKNNNDNHQEEILSKNHLDLEGKIPLKTNVLEPIHTNFDNIHIEIEEEKIEFLLEEFLKKLIFYEITSTRNSSKNIIPFNNLLQNETEKMNFQNENNLKDESFFKEFSLFEKINNIFNIEEGHILVNSVNNNNNFQKNNKDSLSFKKLGEFYLKKETKQVKFFVVYFRNINNILDIVIHDNTTVKVAEKNIIEGSLKKKILAKIAHEFKTPLNSIIGLINQVKENFKKNIFTIKSSINEKSKILNKNNLICGKYKNVKNNLEHKIDLLSNSSSTLKAEQNIIYKDLILIEYLSNYTIYLLNDVINFITCEDNYSEIQVLTKKLNVKKILKFCFEILKALISCNESKQKYINPQLSIDEKIQFYEIYSDEVRLNQILLNFISNAVKFTREGSIIIKANISEDNFLIISVQDTGIGIKDEDKKMILKEEKFKTNYETNKFGSGLGLSICKVIAEKLNHSIEFKSEFNFGSIFSLKIKTKENENFMFDLDSSDFSENKDSIVFYNKTITKSDSYSNSLNSRSNSLSNKRKKIISKSNEINSKYESGIFSEFGNIDIKTVSKRLSDNLSKLKVPSIEPSLFKKRNSVLNNSDFEKTKIIKNFDLNFIFNFSPSIKINSDNKTYNNTNFNSCNIYSKKKLREKDNLNSKAKFSKNNYKEEKENEIESNLNNKTQSINDINIEIFSNNSNSDSEIISSNTFIEFNNNIEKDEISNLNSLNYKFLNSSIEDCINFKKPRIYKEEEKEFEFNKKIRETISVANKNMKNSFDINNEVKNKKKFLTSIPRNISLNPCDFINFPIKETKIAKKYHSNKNLTIISNHFSISPQIKENEKIILKKKISFAIIDDNKYIRNSIKKILESFFY